MISVYSRALIILLMLLITGVPVRAQETPDAPPGDAKEKAKAEEVEATSNLRDSIHENLETLSEDAEIAEDLKKEAADELPDEQSQEKPIDVPGPGAFYPRPRPDFLWAVGD